MAGGKSVKMYQIYIRYFIPPANWAGSADIRKDEVLMYKFPLENPDEGTLIDPKVKNEMGKAGSFEFSMEPDNPWYSSLLQIKTMLRVKYDDETIFYGRVLAINDDMWGKRKVHCEGALAFLLDTMMEPSDEKDRKKISLKKYVKDLLDTHNRLTQDETIKQFKMGQMPGNYSWASDEMRIKAEEDRKFGTGNWTSILKCFEDLTSQYGGYFRARYKDSEDKLFLDWLQNYFAEDVINQPLEVADNIIDAQNTVDVNGVFTVLIPEGSKNGKPLYLDDIPKTVHTKVLPPKPKPPIEKPGQQGTDNPGDGPTPELQ